MSTVTTLRLHANSAPAGLIGRLEKFLYDTILDDMDDIASLVRQKLLCDYEADTDIVEIDTIKHLPDYPSPDITIYRSGDRVSIYWYDYCFMLR